ncbi:S-adenosyl-L-methionine-dependent methyltransferase [Chaetomium sp. MPI-SDFR-AT-0129]|nr:S-adenosyl-L-methionine-dependent methyltransferase [Chaetomium sp. MPI-SDFR-AT-0129]
MAAVAGAAAAGSRLETAAAPVESKRGWTEHETETIEVDEDLASELDDESGDASSYATSLASSVVDYPFEHGRRYHAYRAGRYSRPNDELEMYRLQLMHNAVTTLIHGLYVAPVDKDKIRRILDIGTGSGIWAVSIADDFPDATIIGNDLSATQAEFVPPNVRFEVDDVEDPWVYPAKFDWIFCRYMAASIYDWPKLMGQILENLNPGGYAEFQDFNLTYYSEDGSLTPTHALREWIETLTGAADSLGRDSNPGSKLEGWARAAGFKDVTHRRYRMPIGTWARDRTLKEAGAWNMLQVLNGLEGLSMRLYTAVLGWTEEEVWVLLERVKRDLADPGVHALFEL